MVLKLLEAAPGAYAAGVSGAPVTKWGLYDTHYTERYLGNPAKDPAPYQAADVIEDASNEMPSRARLVVQRAFDHWRELDEHLPAHAARRGRRVGVGGEALGGADVVAGRSYVSTSDTDKVGAALARVLQFGDSTFPIGSFSFSAGLESAIQLRKVGLDVTLVSDRPYKGAWEVDHAVDEIARLAGHPERGEALVRRINVESAAMARASFVSGSIQACISSSSSFSASSSIVLGSVRASKKRRSAAFTSGAGRVLSQPSNTSTFSRPDSAVVPPRPPPPTTMPSPRLRTTPRMTTG